MLLLVISARPVCSPGRALKGKKQNILFLMVTSFLSLHWVFAVTIPNFPVCLGITPAFGLSCSPGQVEALLGSPCTLRD